MSTAVVVGLLTTPDRDVAERIVNSLVTEGLIACGNISAGVTSIYRWQGAIERAEEVLVIIKTAEVLSARAVSRIRELHPYDVPEVLFLPVTSGNDAYVDWLRTSVSK